MSLRGKEVESIRITEARSVLVTYTDGSQELFDEQYLEECIDALAPESES